jgi:hypothetical protein
MDGSDDSDTVSLVPINMLITNINLPWVEAQYIQNIIVCFDIVMHESSLFFINITWYRLIALWFEIMFSKIFFFMMSIILILYKTTNSSYNYIWLQIRHITYCCDVMCMILYFYRYKITFSLHCDLRWCSSTIYL